MTKVVSLHAFEQTVSSFVAASVEQQCREGLEAGDHDRVLTLLMQAYGRELHRYCWALLRERALAEDMLQTVFVQAHEGLATFELRFSFKVWLYGIARHRCLDELRRRRRWSRLIEARAVEIEVPASAHDHEGEAELRAWTVELQDCLTRLTPANRELVWLRFREDISYDEIASLTGDEVGALRVRVCRSLTALRRCLQQKGRR